LYIGKFKGHGTDRTRNLHGRRAICTVWSKIPEEMRSRGAARQRRGRTLGFVSIEKETEMVSRLMKNKDQLYFPVRMGWRSGLQRGICERRLVGSLTIT